MEGKHIKVNVIKQYKQLEYLFKLGDVVTIISILYDDDTVLVRETTEFNPNTGMHEVVNPATIAKKGSFKSYNLIAPNGEVYPESSIFNAIGYVPLSGIFSKPS